MRKICSHLSVAVMVLAVFAGAARGQVRPTPPESEPAPATDRATAGRVVPPELPGNRTSVHPGQPLDADASSRTKVDTLPPEVKAQLLRFNAARDAYLNQQLQLERQFNGANAADRNAIREQIRVSRERWLQQSKTFRDDAAERMRELKRALPKHRDALDETRAQKPGRRPAGLD